MPVELDHVFICVSPGADEANHLANYGLSEGTPNEHPGQGTACRRFFFRNAYLELLWVSNPAEAQSAAAQPTCLWERWARRKTDLCPFGVGLRPDARVALDEVELPDGTDPRRLFHVHEALDRLAVEDPTKAEIVKLRFFVGLENREIGELLGISERTVERAWRFAKAWLLAEFSDAR